MTDALVCYGAVCLRDYLSSTRPVMFQRNLKHNGNNHNNYNNIVTQVMFMNTYCVPGTA